MKSEDFPRDSEGLPIDATRHMAAVCREAAAGFIAAAEAYEIYAKQRPSFQGVVSANLSGSTPNSAEEKHLRDCVMANDTAVNDALAAVHAKVTWLFDCTGIDFSDETPFSDVIELEDA